MKTTTLILASLFSILPVCANAENAQGFKLNTGVYVDEGDPLLGLSYEIPINFNLDGRFELDTNTRNPMWAGIGMGAIRREVGNFDETDFGVNLLWGMDFNRNQNWMPYLNTKAVLSDDSYFMVGFGIRFGHSGSSRSTASAD